MRYWKTSESTLISILTYKKGLNALSFFFFNFSLFNFFLFSKNQLSEDFILNSNFFKNLLKFL